MVALAAQPILTTIGRVAVPKLADTLVRTGANKFVKQYGQKAFEAVLGTTAGLKAYKETEEYLTEYLNHIDSGGDEGSFVPKGSMPGTDRMTQMDAAMAVPNVNESVRETGQGLLIGGEAKEILPPPEPFSTPIDSQTATILSTPIPEKVDTTLSTPIPEKIDTKESFPDQSGELSKPIIYNKDDSTDKLVRGIGDNNPPSSIEEEPTDAVKQTDNILGNDLNISTTLDDKLLNDLLVMRGGIKGFNEKMSTEFAPMPGATKSKMEITLQEKLFDKYDIDKYPEGKTPENSTKEESDALRKKYNTQLQGIEYIVSVAYDAIGEKGVNKNINYGYPIFTLDNEGLPVAGAKIKKFKKPSVDTSIEFNKDNPGARIKNIEALYITEMGSINSNATTKLLNKITEIAKENKIPYVVVEDLTSEEALKAFKKRGYEGTLKKEYKPFIGRKIQRPYSNRLIRQKNLVLKLPQ